MGLGLARSVITTKITRIVEEPQVEAEVTGSVIAALFGLDGFRVLAAADAGGELELLVETIAGVVPCPDCGAVARAKDRRAVWVRDLPIGGRPATWRSICSPGHPRSSAPHPTHGGGQGRIWTLLSLEVWHRELVSRLNSATA